MNMNTQIYPNTDPAAFAVWVRKVAAVNEQFSEVIRDTADLVVNLDPTVAVSLYQAADTASQTVHQLRQLVIDQETLEEPKPPESKSSAWGWLMVGFLLGAIMHIIAPS